MYRSATPASRSIRLRVAVGVSVAAVAASTAFAVSAASAKAPPSEPPPSEPAGGQPSEGDRDTELTVPEPSGDLGLDRRALVESILLLGRVEDIPFDRECVAGLVAGLPDGDVPWLLLEVAGTAAQSAVDDITLPDFTLPDIELPELTLPEIELPQLTMPDVDLPGGLTLPDVELPDFSLPDIELPQFSLPDIELPELPELSVPQLSDEAEALGVDLIYCVDGDADPALVQQALDAIATAPDGVELDLECAAAIMSSFPDELLQAIFDNGGSLERDGMPLEPPDGEISKSSLLIACFELDLEG